MSRSEFIGLFGGLLLFICLSVALHMIEVPELGRWQFFLEILAWIGVLAASVYLTRGWLVPLVFAGAGFLMTAGERWAQMLVEQGSDRKVFLGMILTLAVNGATLILLLAGLFLMFRGVLRRFFPPQSDHH